MTGALSLRAVTSYRPNSTRVLVFMVVRLLYVLAGFWAIKFAVRFFQ